MEKDELLKNIPVIIVSGVVSLITALIVNLINNKIIKRRVKDKFIREREYDTHEKIFKEIKILMEDQETSWLFKRKNKANKNKKNKILSFLEFSKEFEKNDFSDLNYDIDNYVLDKIRKKLIEEIEKLTKRSKKNIRKIALKIINEYEKENKIIELEQEYLADDFGCYEGKKISLIQDAYIKYNRTQREIVLLEKLIPLLIKLKNEIKNYIII
jgi:hypothetical protein